MKWKSLSALLLASLFCASAALAGGSAPARCKTRYPVVLAHGFAFSAKVLGIVDYWWGIEGALEDEGAAVYVTSVNGMDGTVAKAKEFKRQFLQIKAVTGSAKMNVIGHSHGAIYSRYAISNLGLYPFVKSLTSICGPHRGSSIADLVMYDLPAGLRDVGTDVVDFLYAWVMGDTNPDSAQNGWDLTTGFMAGTFNPGTPNMAGVYYQSWASQAKWSCPWLVLEPLWVIMLAKEGPNDGVVGVESAKWGNFRGVEKGAWYSSGVDHAGMVGHFLGFTPGFDPQEFYVDLVEELKNKGY
ncbi:MAG: alpha/beta fold hydrolase [Thermodesulfobacteriota bacterium]